MSPEKVLESRSAGWVCRFGGHRVRPPSATLGCSWCPECETYDRPLEVIVEKVDNG